MSTLNFVTKLGEEFDFSPCHVQRRVKQAPPSAHEVLPDDLLSGSALTISKMIFDGATSQKKK